jgi:hypothetical protein
MTSNLRRYWFRFGELPPFTILRLGCGITAFNKDDAIVLLRERVFAGREMPTIAEVTEDVDISTLDRGHVLPNMGVVGIRGVWFPLGYEQADNARRG